MNETKDEELLVKYNSFINVPGCFKLFECGRKLLKNIDVTYEQACMETLQGNGIQKILGMDNRAC